MPVFKLININFYKNFLEKNLIPPFYNTVYNNSISQDCINNQTASINSFKNVITSVNYIPPFFDLNLEDHKNTFELFTVFTYNGFLVNLQKHEGVDDYLKTQFKSKSRYTLKRRLKRLEQCFSITYKDYIGDIKKENYDYLFDELKLMIQKRFSQRGDEHVSIHNWSFYKESVYNMILDRKSVLYVVYDKEKPIAISLNYLHQNIFDYAISSYDIDYSKFGIGNIVILKELEWCFNNGYEIINMRSGDFRYKREWCNVIYKYRSHILFKKNRFDKKLMAFLFSKNILFKVYFRKKVITPTLKLLKKLNNTANNGHLKGYDSLCTIKKHETADILLTNKYFKLNINEKENMFLRKYVYDFQYSQLENSKNVSIYKINSELNKNYIIIGTKKSIELQFT
jgi:hypothetical protein